MSTKVSSFYKNYKLFRIHIFFDYNDHCNHLEIWACFFSISFVYWKPLRYIYKPRFISKFACKIGKHDWLLEPPYNSRSRKYKCQKCDVINKL